MTKPTPLIAGNWKMNKTPSAARRWAEAFRDALGQPRADLLICAPFTHLPGLVDAFSGSPVQVGAQDVSAHLEGAYTGEVSAAMLKDVGVAHVIIGHSERREHHREDDALVNAKVRQARARGLTPILCVGEREAERDAGEAEAVVLGQLRAGLAAVDVQDPDELVVAYEPVWAIGTGKTATADDAQAMSAAIRGALRELCGAAASGVRVLYGGSMKPDNARELLAKPDVNGGLIGGASLSQDDLLAIVAAA